MTDGFPGKIGVGCPELQPALPGGPSYTRKRILGLLPPNFLKEWAAFPQRELKEVFYLNTQGW